MKATSHHLQSLDVFRGLTIAGMILVNHPGDWTAVYEPLSHAAWDGCTLADLVFPFFLVIVGVAMAFAFARRQAAGMASLRGRILRRAVVLVALGLVLNVVATPSLGAVRVPGVLQRIGVVYACAAAIVLTTEIRGRLVWIAGLLSVYWTLVAFVPFGGHAAGALTPDANLPGYLDARVLGRHLLLPHADPEGLLSTLPAVATTLLGSLAGWWLRSESDDRRRVLGLVIAGGLVAGGGAVLARWMPINKTMWTPPFALWCAGLGAIALGVCYLAVDAAGLRRWSRPFVWLGVNPLAIYFCSELVGHLLEKAFRIGGELTTAQSWLFWNVFDPALGEFMSQPALSLAVAILHVVLWTAIAGFLYRRSIRIAV